MPTDNICVYMAYVCFYVCCSDCVVEDARGDHMEEAYSRDSLMTAWWVAMSVSSFYLPHAVAVSAFIICRGLCAVLRCCECVCCM